MKLAFSHTGKRFFFITLALEGRPRVLSSLIDERARPKLTTLGEIVKAAFVAVHEKMLPCSLPPRYDPSAEDSRELAADRLLILSGFTDTPTVPACDIRKHLAASRQFRANCLTMNDLAALLCEKATEMAR